MPFLFSASTGGSPSDFWTEMSMQTQVYINTFPFRNTYLCPDLSSAVILPVCVIIANDSLQFSFFLNKNGNDTF